MELSEHMKDADKLCEYLNEALNTISKEDPQEARYAAAEFVKLFEKYGIPAKIKEVKAIVLHDCKLWEEIVTDELLMKIAYKFVEVLGKDHIKSALIENGGLPECITWHNYHIREMIEDEMNLEDDNFYEEVKKAIVSKANEYRNRKSFNYDKSYNDINDALHVTLEKKVLNKNWHWDKIVGGTLEWKESTYDHMFSINAANVIGFVLSGFFYEG